MRKFEDIKKRKMEIVREIFSWIFNLAGLVLAVVSLRKNSNIEWYIVLGIVIFNSILLMGASIYVYAIDRRSKDVEGGENERLKMEMERLFKELQMGKMMSRKLRFYFKEVIAMLNDFTVRLLAINYKYSEDVKLAREIEDETIREKFEKIACENYWQAMSAEYDRFLGNITSRLKDILDIELQERGFVLGTAIAIKQFSRIVTERKNLDGVEILTTFRDKKTYSSDEREIGQKRHTLVSNPAFTKCIKSRTSYYLRNNIEKIDSEYESESRPYNCTIVVPICCEYPKQSHMYGYLGCDVQNDDANRKDVFDKEMVEVAAATANIIGLYFDNVDFQWSQVLHQDFLAVIFERKCRENGIWEEE